MTGLMTTRMRPPSREIPAAPPLVCPIALGEGACSPSADAISGRGSAKVLLTGIGGVRPDVLAEVSTPVMDSLAAGDFDGNRRPAAPAASHQRPGHLHLQKFVDDDALNPEFITEGSENALPRYVENPHVRRRLDVAEP